MCAFKTAILSVLALHLVCVCVLCHAHYTGMNTIGWHNHVLVITMHLSVHSLLQ